MSVFNGQLDNEKLLMTFLNNNLNCFIVRGMNVVNNSQINNIHEKMNCSDGIQILQIQNTASFKLWSKRASKAKLL